MKFGVAGRGHAQLPVPAWLRASRFAAQAGIACAIAAGAFALAGWDWVADASLDGVGAGFAIACALVATLAVAPALATARLRLLDPFYRVRFVPGSTKSDEGKHVYGGFRSRLSPPLVAAVSLAPLALAALAVAHAVQCPYCIDAYTKDTLEKGCDLDQLTEVVHVAAAIKGGAALVHGIQMRNKAEKVGM